MKLNNGSYYQMKNDEAEASIIHLSNEDGRNPNTYALQIRTSDGGLWCFGHLPEKGFDIRPSTAIVNKALAENKDFDWWKANGDVWFTANVVVT